LNIQESIMPSSERARLRVASIDFLNTAPLIWGLDRESRIERQIMLPSECADRLRDGSADIGIIPVIEMARLAGLVALPGIAIAANDRVASILLVSRVPPARIRRLALDRSSRTSLVLVQLLLKHRFGAEFVATTLAPDWQRMLEENDAALLIGDPALKLGLSGDAQRQGLAVYDLAHEWRLWTGFGFVFAVWAVREDVLKPSDADWLISRFQRARAEGMAHLPQIAETWSGRLGISTAAVLGYLTENVEYELNASHLAGLRRYYELASDEGIIADSALPRFLASAAENNGAASAGAEARDATEALQKR
jgi:chorismate dehydratase